MEGIECSRTEILNPKKFPREMNDFITPSNPAITPSSYEEYPSVALTTSTGLVFVKKTDILYCLAENSYTNVYLDGGKKVTISKHLKKVEQALPYPNFVRIHDSHLINLQHLVRFVNDNHSCVLMTNGEELSVSRNKKKEFLQRFVRI